MQVSGPLGRNPAPAPARPREQTWEHLLVQHRYGNGDTLGRILRRPCQRCLFQDGRRCTNGEGPETLGIYPASSGQSFQLARPLAARAEALNGFRIVGPTASAGGHGLPTTDTRTVISWTWPAGIPGIPGKAAGMYPHSSEYPKSSKTQLRSKSNKALSVRNRGPFDPPRFLWQSCLTRTGVVTRR